MKWSRVWIILSVAAVTLVLPISQALSYHASVDVNAPSAASSPTALPDLAYARAQVAKYRKIPAFVPPGPAFDATKARGKTIFIMGVDVRIPFVAGVNRAMQRAAKIAGIKTIVYPVQGQPSQWVAGINQAIARKVNLIVIHNGIPSGLLRPQIAAAKKAGIPVIDVYHDVAGTPIADGLTAKINVPSPAERRVLADWTIVDSGGHVNGLIVTSDEITPSKPIRAAIASEYKARCGSGCKVRVVNVPLADWATKIQTEVQSALVRDPQINYVLPVYDSMSPFAIAAIVAAGKKSSIKIASGDATPSVMKNIQDGNVVAFDIGTSTDWIGWANVDVALRVLAGARPPGTSARVYQFRAWDKTNINQAGRPPRDSAGYGDSYIRGYKKLWRLTK